MNESPAFFVGCPRNILALLGKPGNLHPWHISEYFVVIVVKLRNGPIPRPLALLVRLIR